MSDSSRRPRRRGRRRVLRGGDDDYDDSRAILGRWAHGPMGHGGEGEGGLHGPQERQVSLLHILLHCSLPLSPITTACTCTLLSSPLAAAVAVATAAARSSSPAATVGTRSAPRPLPFHLPITSHLPRLSHRTRRGTSSPPPPHLHLASGILPSSTSHIARSDACIIAR